MAEHETLERVLGADYLDGLASWDTKQVRQARAECEREEAGISYARRILQGRLDLLRAELERRHQGGDDLSSVLEDLTVILSSDHTPSSPAQARAVTVHPPETAATLEAEIDAIVDASEAHGDDLERLADLIDRLAVYESHLSELRRQLFARIDLLREELVQRYKDGRASVADLLEER